MTALANTYGSPLAAADYTGLGERWIDRATADGALLRRVRDNEGRDLLMDRRRDCAGIMIPYFWPGDGNMYCCRIRRDHPEMEAGKASRKYLAAHGDRNRLYLPPWTAAAALADVAVPVVITEGEFKAMALARLAAGAFVAVGLSGVWNWKGVIGVATDETGARVPEKGPIPDLSRIAWAGRKVIIAFDSDAAKNPSVRAARYALSVELRGRGAVVGVLEWAAEQGKGIDDWLAAAGPGPVTKAMEAVDFDRTTGWRAKLRCTDAGKPKPLLLNIDIALRQSEEWAGAIGFDTFRQKTVLTGPSPIGGCCRDWTDAEDTRTALWLQKCAIEVGRDQVGAVINSIAIDNPIHPLRDWLDGLQWDGTPRVDTWLTEYLGVSPSEYVASVGRMWLVSAVARVMKPGCKVDHMLVLEGPQGAGKSKAIRILTGDKYFCDSLPAIESKDAQLQTFGSWVVEWGELDALSRAETTAVKAFITRQVEKLRRPYGRHTEEVPRQCVFVGTTNADGYLKDETGNRRFWPVICGHIDFDRLAEDREQIWAEVVALYQDGAKWWPERAGLISEAAAEQARRVQIDPWADRIERFVDGLESVRAERILGECIEIEVGRHGQVERNRVGRILRLLGWRPASLRDGERVVRGFRRG